MLQFMGEQPHNEVKCPLASVDRRLEDVHQQWHAAEAAYFDPDRFRIAIQTAIQTMRTVTFVLQSNKRHIANFDTWYESWQVRLRADSLMKWMVDARNRIEKQGDLEAHSFIRAEIVASYLDNGVVVEVPSELSATIDALIESIPKNELGVHIQKHGTLRVQRRWVENSLPTHELLDAVARAFGTIAQLVDDAHVAAGVSPPVTENVVTEQRLHNDRGGRLPCMIGHSDLRTLNISLATGDFGRVALREWALNPHAKAAAKERYDLPSGAISPSAGYDATAHQFFTVARKMMEKDGNHVTVVFFFRAFKVVRMMPLAFGSQAEKYLIMREVANEAIRIGADAALLIGEVWTAKADPSNPYMHAVDAENRREMLTANLVRKEGEAFYLAAVIERIADQVHLGPTEEIRGASHSIFGPLYAAWGRDTVLPD
jgi:hypothetical protein